MRKKRIVMYMSFAFICFMVFMLNVNAIESVNEYIKCGGHDLPAPIAPITRTTYAILQIVLPIAIIVLGSLDFLKAVIAADDAKIKKNQAQFLNRLKAGAIFFFVSVILKFGISIVADKTESDNISNCIDCLINDEKKCGSITKTNPYIK